MRGAETGREETVLVVIERLVTELGVIQHEALM